MVKHRFTTGDRVIVVLDKSNTNVRPGTYTVVLAVPFVCYGPQYRVKHAGLIPLHAQAKSLLRKFATYDIRHVPRKANAAADAVVNQVLDSQA